MKKLRGRKLITTDWVIAESGALIRRKLGFKESRLFLEAVEEGRATGVLEIVFVDEDLLREEMALFLEWANPKLSLVDAVSIALCKGRGIKEALAFDRHFEEAGMKLYSSEETLK